MENNAQPEQNQTGPDTTGFIIAPMAAAAALDAAAFSKVDASEAVPATWEERARKAWEYYVEEPLVKNCVNSWRTFAVGDEIKIAGDHDKLKDEATEAAYRLNLPQFVNDMIGEPAKDDGHDPRDQAGRPQDAGLGLRRLDGATRPWRQDPAVHLSKLEKKGLAFASDEERESELKRLSEMSDEAFAATEAAYERMTKGAKPEKGEPATGKDDENAKKAAKTGDDPPLRSDAGVRPRDVDDRKLSLEDRLRSGFMAAYRNRVGEESDETLQLDA